MPLSLPEREPHRRAFLWDAETRVPDALTFSNYFRGNRIHQPAVLTPLRKPPMCPVRATTTAARSSTGSRSAEQAASGLRWVRKCSHHTSQINAVDARPDTR